MNTLTDYLAKWFDWQSRTPNTLSLRNEYNNYMTKVGLGEAPAMQFGDWAAKYYPDMKILRQ